MLTKVTPISVKYGIGVHKHDQEGRVLTLEFEKFFLISCYTPNSGEFLQRLDYRTKEWDVDFFKYIESLEANGKAVIIGGDLNCAHDAIDIYDPCGDKMTHGYTA